MNIPSVTAPETSASDPAANGRRSFLRKMGLATAGTAGAASMLGLSQTARAADPAAAVTETDIAVLKFALNLEYLEAEYYLRATTGQGLEAAGIDVDSSTGRKGGRVFVKDNPKVKFGTRAMADYADEIAFDETNHVRFLREALEANGATAIPRPIISLDKSFEVLGRLIGVRNFDPFQNETTFLIGAFVFEDVGVTAYKGAAPLLTNAGILEAAAGILGVEAYHAGIIRTLLYSRGKGVRDIIKKVSRVRRSLDNVGGRNEIDQDLDRNGMANLVPTDSNSIAFSRTTRQVLNIVYGEIDASRGLFFPTGLNGPISS